MTRNELRRRVEAAEAQAAHIRERERQKAAAFDLSGLSYDELREVQAAFYVRLGGLTEDEAYLLVFQAAYYRHEARDCQDPRFPAAARRAITAMIERHVRCLRDRGVPSAKAERLRDLAFMRRVNERARRYVPSWNRHGFPYEHELEQALRDIDGEGVQEDGAGATDSRVDPGVIPSRRP
jgi:hypothetical protein